jgi:hypothetical protein
MVAGDGEVMLFPGLGSGLVGVVRTLLRADFGFRISGFGFGRLALGGTVEITPYVSTHVENP